MDSETGATTAAERDRRRYLHRLAIAADTTQPNRLRIAAVNAIQASLHPINPLKNIRAEVLLDRVLWPWQERLFKDRLGRTFEAPVRRPPEELSDLWG
jgi:hypothetical protein